MRYQYTLTGITPLVCHNGTAGLDPNSPIKREIASITGRRGTRTAAENEQIAKLECMQSLYVGNGDRPGFPSTAIRAAVEAAARKTKQGSLVREGLIVETCELGYDTERYGETLKKVAEKARLTVPVVVQRSRILRTRACFEMPWELSGTMDADGELIEEQALLAWLDVAGRRIGVGDWRPEKSGIYGRFTPELKAI